MPYYSKKQIILFITIFFALSLFLASDAYAANWYVRPSEGSGSGTSWTAAWNGLGAINWSSVSCGDTIWVAGGIYAQSLSPAKNCTSGLQLYIRRARSDAAGSTGAAGWSSGYDSTVVQQGSSTLIYFPYGKTNNYITISGRTTASGGDYGWKVSMPGVTTGTAILYGNQSVQNYITLEYMEVAGPGNGWNSTGSLNGIVNAPYNSSSTYHTFSHMSIHGWAVGVFNQYQTNALYEYIDMYDIYGNGTDHPDLFYIADGSYGTIRHSKFHNSCANGSGIFFTSAGSTNYWNIYGNIFYDNTGDGSCTVMKLREGTVLGLKIFNNTFSNNDANLTVSDGTCGSGCETRNNIFHGTGGSSTYGIASNNLATSSSSLFVNSAAKDFHIVSITGSGYPRNAGTAIPSYFTTDMDGVVFGQDGIWDIGAYEYIASSPQLDITPPSIPANLVAQAVSSSQINLSWSASTDNVGVAGYRVFRNSVQIATSTATNYSNIGLTPSTTYSYTVSAYDASSNASSQSTAIQTTTLPASSASSYEAESCSLIAPMQIVSDSSASGGQYIKTSASESGTATCNFSVSDAGLYKITARVFAPSGGTDSFYFQTDNSPEDIWDLNPTASPSEYNVWREDDLAKRGTGTFDNPQYDPYTINLSSGTHTLAFRGRESNARLDYFYLTRVTDITPPSAPQNLIVN